MHYHVEFAHSNEHLLLLCSLKLSVNDVTFAGSPNPYMRIDSPLLFAPRDLISIRQFEIDLEATHLLQPLLATGDL